MVQVRLGEPAFATNYQFYLPDDRIELANLIEKIINKFLEIDSKKQRFPILNHFEWQLILIKIFNSFLEARLEREGKPRLDYVEQAKEIVSGLY